MSGREEGNGTRKSSIWFIHNSINRVCRNSTLKFPYIHCPHAIHNSGFIHAYIFLCVCLVCGSVWVNICSIGLKYFNENYGRHILLCYMARLWLCSICVCIVDCIFSICVYYIGWDTSCCMFYVYFSFDGSHLGKIYMNQCWMRKYFGWGLGYTERQIEVLCVV